MVKMQHNILIFSITQIKEGAVVQYDLFSILYFAEALRECSLV